MVLKVYCLAGLFMFVMGLRNPGDVGLLVAGPLTSVIIVLIIVWSGNMPRGGWRLFLLVIMQVVAAVGYFFSSAAVMGVPLMLFLVVGTLLTVIFGRKKAAG